MIRINLLPQRRRRRLVPESGVVLVAVVVIGALAGAQVWESLRNRRVAAETAEINRKLVVARQQAAEVLALEAKVEDLKAQEDLLRSLEARELPWAEMLTDLAARTPHDAWLGGAAVGAGPPMLLSLQGSALSYDGVARFMRSLAGSPFYSDMDLQAAQRGGGSGSTVQFGLSLTMVPIPSVPTTPRTTTPTPPTPAAPEPSR